VFECGLQLRVVYINLPEKANEDVADKRKHIFHKQWRSELRNRGPPVKIAPAPLRFNPALIAVDREVLRVLLGLLPRYPPQMKSGRLNE